jgi:hypothetical protein
MTQQFHNCEMEFECPRDWFELEQTNKAGTKHCNQCHKDVHLCINQEDLAQAIEKKLCIALFKDPNHQTNFRLSREKCEANAKDPAFKPLVLLGLPRNYMSERLLKFLDEE